MGWATGAPLAVGARLILDGHVKRQGVLSPETAFASRELFTLLEQLWQPEADPRTAHLFYAASAGSG